MATTTSSGQAHYVEFDEYVDSKIAKTRETIRSTDIMVALVAAAAAVLGYLLLFVIADHWLGMDFVPPLARLVLGCTILGGSIVWAIWRIGLPNRRRINRLYVAREIEHHESALEGNLLNLVDLQQADRRIGLPVMRSIEKRAAVGLSKTDLDGTVDRGLLMRTSYTLLALVVAACLYTLLTVSLGLKPIGPSLMRAFGASAMAPTRIQFESVQTQIADGDSFVDAESEPRVPARFQPMIQATLNKAIGGNEHVTLYFTTADQRFVDEPLEMRQVEGSLQEVFPEYSVTLLGENERGLLQDLTFRIEAGDAVTPIYSIQVSTAPSATVVSIDYNFPNYMRLEDESRDSPNVEGWEGTNVTVHARTSVPVQSARLVFSDTEDTSQRAEEYPMHVTEGTKLSVAWHLAFRDGDPENYPKFYRIVCRDEQGATDLHPTLHSIAIRPDLPPEVELLDPRSDLTLPANAVLPLLVKARDPDFQLKHLTLRVELDGKQLLEHNRELFAGEQPSFGPQSVDFPLEPLGLQPGQTISYWIEARDNKMPLGNRTNTAPKLNILITEPVSPEEARKQQKQRKEQQDEQVRQKQEQEQQDKQEQDGQDQDDQPKDQPPESGDPDAKPQDSDTNPDGKTEPGESPTDGDDKADQRTGKSKPGDDMNDSPNEQGSDKPGDQDGGNTGDQKNEQNTNKNSDSSGNPPSSSSSPKDGSEDNPDSKPGSGKPDPNAEPLNNDGTDDAEALDRVREFQSKQNDKTTSGETPDSDPDGQEPKPKPGDDNNTNSAQNSKSKTDPNTPADSKNKAGNQADKKGDAPKTSANRKTPDQEPGNKDGKTGQGASNPNKDSKDNRAPAQPKDKKQNKTGDAASKSNNGPRGKKSDTDTKKGERGSEPDGSKPQPKTGKGDAPPKKGADSQKGEGTLPDEKTDAANKTKGGSNQKPDTAKPGSAADGDDPKKTQSGEATSKTGNKSSSNKKPGNQKSGKKGGTKSGPKNGTKDNDPNGKKDKKTDDKSGGKKDGQGGDANKPGGKPGSKPSNKPGSKGGAGKAGKNSTEGTGGTAGKQAGNAQQGEQPGEQPNKGKTPASNSEDPDPVNEEFTKEAANLVLKRLEDEINRGDVDPELLKQLGWTKDDVSKFADRLRDSVDTPDNDNSPESQAKRRQFENLLKDIAIKSNGSKRTGRSQRTRKTTSINTQDIPVPLQFREAAKLYRRNLTSRRTRTTQPPRATKPAKSGN